MENAEFSFSQFIAAGCNRQQFIQQYLKNIGLECPVIQLDGHSHLYVKFPKESYDGQFKIKTLIAHYDIFPGSPGANDNSSSVYSLLLLCKRLSGQKIAHNLRIIFTDGEELGRYGVNQQGAFGLAQTFRKLGVTNDNVFVFDCMGRGSVPVLCETKLPPGLSKAFIDQFNRLEASASKVLDSACQNHWFKLPCSYSDNAGFLANGIPAVAFTMLPAEEIEQFLYNGKNPLTWEMLHSKDDNIENLDEKAFDLTAVILNKIAALKSLS